MKCYIHTIMNTLLYVYTVPGNPYKIVKLIPFTSFRQCMDQTGRSYNDLIQGIPMIEPEWEWIREWNGRIIAKFMDHMYDITDVLDSKM